MICLSCYRLRKQVVEPVIGQIKSALGFTRFLLRGLENVRHEWALVCMASNLRKLAAASSFARLGSCARRSIAAQATLGSGTGAGTEETSPLMGTRS